MSSLRMMFHTVDSRIHCVAVMCMLSLWTILQSGARDSLTRRRLVIRTDLSKQEASLFVELKNTLCLKRNVSVALAFQKNKVVVSKSY
jgi:hypothetical protein